LNSKRITSEIQVGDYVDVRDKDYVWCKGIIKMILESAKREPIYLIHYEGFDDAEDEVLFKNSPRLAKPGYYTSRCDIPRYRFDKSLAGTKQTMIINKMQSKTSAIQNKIESSAKANPI
jgi:hypothetical protein